MAHPSHQLVPNHSPDAPAATAHHSVATRPLLEDSDSDTTPKAANTALPQQELAYSTVGDNMWKDLGTMQAMGANGILGLTNRLDSPQPQPGPKLGLVANSNKATPDSDGSVLHMNSKRKRPVLVPSRPAPRPPTMAKSGSSTIKATRGKAHNPSIGGRMQGIPHRSSGANEELSSMVYDMDAFGKDKGKEQDLHPSKTN